jgi:putative FmdB family regulatory protein
MPIYAYRCRNCNYQFDIRQRFADDPLTCCPRCEGQVKRVISPVGVVFKGSGFYVTDNRNGSSMAYSNGLSKSTDDKAASSEPGEKVSKKEEKPASESKEKSAKSAAESSS